jgi:subtilisin
MARRNSPQEADRERAVAPADAPPAPGAPEGGDAPVTSRRDEYLIGTVRREALPQGVEPLSANVLEQALRNDPSVEVVKSLTGPRVLSFGRGGDSSGGAVFVARMDDDRARVYMQTAAQSPQVIFEQNALVSLPESPGPALAGPPARPTAGPIARDPGVVFPADVQLTLALTILGRGAPVQGADVFIYGSLWPVQGVTDGTGQVRLTLYGESPTTIRGLYVKPKSGFWSLWIPRPNLDPARNNVVTLSPLESGPLDATFPQQEMLGWGQKAMGLDQIPRNFRGEGVTVAVVDSGAQTTHPDIQQVRAGFDITAGNDQTWTQDQLGHGTHCIGVIAGLDNGTGIRGFAPGARIFAPKIFPGGRFSDVLDALDRCIDQQVDVINLSLGSSDRSQLLEQKLRQAKDQGIACIVAAGNSNGPVQFPALLTDVVLAVSAIGRQGTFPQQSYHSTEVYGATTTDGYFSANFTCFGPEIALCGPGVAIVSSVPFDNGYAAWDGTSMAAPHVTGLAALVLAHHPDFQGAFRARNAQRVERLFTILRASAQPLAVADSTRVGAGLPNAVRALGLALTPTPERQPTPQTGPPPATPPVRPTTPTPTSPPSGNGSPNWQELLRDFPDFEAILAR